MWCPPQQQCWQGYVQHISPQQQRQQIYSTTSYYLNTDKSSMTNQAANYIQATNNENESIFHYHSTRADDVYVTGIDSTGSYSDEMSSSSLPYQTSNTHWNSVITTPTKTTVITPNLRQNHVKSNSSSSSACWDWLLFPPEYYSHLYTPSSSFVQQQQQQDDDLDLLARLPSWLLAMLYPSMKQTYGMDDENDSDQEISSLNNNNDEPLLSINIDKNTNHVSSNLSLSSENPPKSKQNRSSTPDTDDGYQSASDASRSDYSQQSSLNYDHHNSKDDITIHVPSSTVVVPKRISYAAAVKPLTTSLNNNNKIVPVTTSMIKTKINSSPIINHDVSHNNNSQKSKFIAPRFERMHNAKQYSTSTMKDQSSPSTLLNNRTQIRSNKNNQRNQIINSSRRR